MTDTVVIYVSSGQTFVVWQKPIALYYTTTVPFWRMPRQSLTKLWLKSPKRQYFKITICRLPESPKFYSRNTGDSHILFNDLALKLVPLRIISLLKSNDYMVSYEKYYFHFFVVIYSAAIQISQFLMQFKINQFKIHADFIVQH